MYAIRVDATRHLLQIELSGRLTTDEALRAVSQAAALAEAGGLRAIACDMRMLHRGPARSLGVAAMVALRFQAGMRIAFIGTLQQVRAADRFVAFSGVGPGAQFFESTADGDAWLEPVLRRAGPLAASTERRHATDLLNTAKQPERAGRIAPRSHGTSGRQPAA